MAQILNRLKKLQIFSGGLSKKLIHTVLIGICSILISCFLFRFDSFKSLEVKSQDVLERLVPQYPKNQNISVIAIDEETINELSWPITRDYYVSLIHILNEYNAHSIVFDIAFIDENANHPAWDSLLALTTGDTTLQSTIIHSFYFSISDNDAVDTGTSSLLSRFSQSGNSDIEFPEAVSADIPFPFLVENIQNLGHFHLTPDNDGIFRRLPTFIDFNNRLYPNLSLLTARHFTLSTTPAIGRRSIVLANDIRKTTIPIDNNGNMRIWYNGNGEQFETLSLLELLYIYKQVGKKQEQPEKLKHFISDKIIIVGNTATALGDYGAIPTNNNIPKVYIHAGAIATMIEKKFFAALPFRLILSITVLFMVLLIAAYFRFKAIAAFTFWLVITLLYICVTYLLRTNLIIIALGLPLTSLLICYTGITVYTHFFKEKQVYLLETALGKYVTPAILEKINTGSKSLVQEKQEREITVLFSDIKGFSIMCNTMDPELLHSQLTEYLNAMADIILEKSGTVDKFMGDGIMAYYDSLSNEKHAVMAIDSALHMLDRVQSLNKEWLTQEKPVISIRIGINTGRVFIGDLGTRKFSDYTLFGNEVNIAQRLESIAEPGTTYVSQSTYEKTIDDFDYMNMGKISLKGIFDPVTCYKVIGHRKLFKGIT